jgi:serine/threonine-protein kinase
MVNNEISLEIPDLEFDALIGAGVTGQVYRARQVKMNRLVAAKIVGLPDIDDDLGWDELRRFRKEAEILANLNHENIVKVHYYGETATHAYLIMELIEGEPLNRRLAGNNRFSLDEVRAIMRDAVAGLAQTHERGVVHRDLKPANFMHRRLGGGTVIIDYGVARNRNSTQTVVGTAIGTPLYVAPEQWMGQPVDARADIYSLTATMYHLLTGERPFAGNRDRVIRQVLYEDPRPPSEVAKHVPPMFDLVVKCGMAKNRDYRYASITEFGSAVERAFAVAEAGGDETVLVGARLSGGTEDRPSVSRTAQTPRNARGRRPVKAPRAQGLRGWQRLLRRFLQAV